MILEFDKFYYRTSLDLKQEVRSRPDFWLSSDMYHYALTRDQTLSGKPAWLKPFEVKENYISWFPGIVLNGEVGSQTRQKLALSYRVTIYLPPDLKFFFAVKRLKRAANEYLRPIPLKYKKSPLKGYWGYALNIVNI